jgi:P22 coat protein - gene protein 5
MPNTLITPTNVSKAALGFWQESNVLCSLFNRVYETEFGGGAGDTITIRKQASLTAAAFNRGTGVVVQDITEGSLTVTVDTIYDVTVQITQEQWDFDLMDFNWQVAEPAGRALSRQAEKLVSNALDAHATTADLDPANPVKSIIGARTVLNKREVPLEDRFMIVGSDTAALLLADPLFLKANENGSDQALRAAQLGRILGMDVYESVVVPADDAYVCHKDALTFVSIVPQVARGTADGASSNYDGLGLRTVFGYDQSKKQDLISFDSYYEVAPLRGDPAFVKLTIDTTP